MIIEVCKRLGKVDRLMQCYQRYSMFLVLECSIAIKYTATNNKNIGIFFSSFDVKISLVGLLNEKCLRKALRQFYS